MIKMRKLGWIAALAALALAGCGGGDSKFVNTGATGPSNAASISVSVSGDAIPTDGSESVTVTALVRDANNVALSGQAVSFSATAGSLVITQATTDASGIATATVAAGGTSAGTQITVTAIAGSVSGTTTINVIGTQRTISLVTDLPQIPSDGSKMATISALVRDANNQMLKDVSVIFTADSGGITVTQATTDENGKASAALSPAADPSNRQIAVTARAGSATATINVAVVGTRLTITGPANLIQGTQGEYTVSLTDSAGKGIANAAVALSSSAGNTLSATTVTTDSTGKKIFQLNAANSGTDTVSATALGMVAQQAVEVSNESFTFTQPASSTKINLGVVQNVTVNWKSGGAPQAGKTINFTSTRGTLSAPSATTNASGDATVSISSTQSGPAVITATGTGVSAQVQLNFVATTAASVILQASPSTVPTEGQSTLTAFVRDAANNLVEGVTVNFALDDITGGALSVASAMTDSQGRAQTVYTATTSTSSKDGVKVTASTTGATSSTAALTVAGQTLFLSLGTGNTINIENSTQYSMDYAVQAIDTAGNPVQSARVTFDVVSLSYLKGVRVWSGKVWVATPSAPVCQSEDLNGNGIFEPTDNDENNNGTLEPGLAAAVAPGSVTTDATGSGFVKVLYPKDHADWVQVRLTATTTVQGSQASTSSEFWLPVASNDVNSETKAPPGPESPYGFAATCSNPN